MISFMTTPADCKRAVVSSRPEAANAKVAKHNVARAIAHFFIKKHFLFITPQLGMNLCGGEYTPIEIRLFCVR